METILEVGFGCLLLGFMLGYSFGYRKRSTYKPQHLTPMQMCMKSSGNFICHLPKFHITACDWQCQELCESHIEYHCKLLQGHHNYTDALAHEWDCK